MGAELFWLIVWGIGVVAEVSLFLTFLAMDDRKGQGRMLLGLAVIFGLLILVGWWRAQPIVPQLLQLITPASP